MMKNRKVIDKVLKKIVPTEEEKKKMVEFIRTLERAADNVLSRYGLEYTLAGSFIRDTWMKNKREVDLFILFPESCPRTRLESDGVKMGKEITGMLGGSYIISYAEHPYVRAKVGKYDIDIVPCYKLKSAEKIKSAVDRTPFHNEYIKQNLKPEMSNEVRLLKQFCSALGIYGSDIKTQGLSGYLCELLIINYKTFANFVKEASKWRAGVFIDIKGHCKIKNVKAAFKNQPLVVIDPTDPKRNVAASLSPKNFMKLVTACKNFEREPSTRFFFRKERRMSKETMSKILDERGTHLLCVEFKRPNVIDDVLFSQLRRFKKRLINELEHHGFSVMGGFVFSNEAFSRIFLELSVWKLPKVEKVRGPPIFSSFHLSQFISKYKNERIIIEGVHAFSERKRKFTHAREMLSNFLRGDEKNLKENGVPSHISKEVSRQFKMLGKEEILKRMANEKEFNIEIKKYFRGSDVWSHG